MKICLFRELSVHKNVNHAPIWVFSVQGSTGKKRQVTCGGLGLCASVGQGYSSSPQGN